MIQYQSQNERGCGRWWGCFISVEVYDLFIELIGFHIVNEWVDWFGYITFVFVVGDLPEARYRLLLRKVLILVATQ